VSVCSTEECIKKSIKKRNKISENIEMQYENFKDYNS